jgi:hypothetical protein
MRNHTGVLLPAVMLLFILTGIAVGQDAPAAGAADKVKTIVNKYFAENKDAVLAGAPVEENGLYKVGVSVNNNTQYFYITRDGALLIFPNGFIDIAKFEKDAKSRMEPGKEDIPKKKKPSVELFVMSLCPYGVQAEKKILPVIGQFGDKIDFRIKYIARVNGGSLDKVASLHGIDEVKEDLRQAAIRAYYPGKFPAYLEKLDEKSCVMSCGEVKLEDYWKKTAQGAGMDTGKIESFVYGQDGIDLLRKDEADGARYGITASPTLVINGVKSNAIQQDAAALERAICSAFANPPGECKTGRRAGPVSGK